MRVRADPVFLSSVLFTIALLNLIPAGLWYFSSGTDERVLARLDAGFRVFGHHKLTPQLGPQLIHRVVGDMFLRAVELDNGYGHRTSLRG